MVNLVTRIIYYSLIKTTINAVGQKEVIIYIFVGHHGNLELIVDDQSLLFVAKFLF